MKITRKKLDKMELYELQHCLSFEHGLKTDAIYSLMLNTNVIVDEDFNILLKIKGKHRADGLNSAQLTVETAQEIKDWYINKIKELENVN